MFAKPYKLKSNNTLKNTEKKHLAQRLHDQFPSTTEEKVKDIMSVKSSCICMKLVLHSGDMVNVYSVDGIPMVIETGERLIPTVCALWKVPDLVPVLAIHTPVLPKVQGGAPVYLPGVSIPSGGIGFPMFQRGTVIGLCTQENAAVCIIGRSTMSSADMLLRAAGVCLETIQVFGDQLCKDNKFSKIERPKLGPAGYSQGDIAIDLTSHVSQMTIQPSASPREQWPSLGKRPPPAQAPLPPQNEPKVIAEEVPEENQDEEEADVDDSILTEDSQIEEDDIPTDMDGLLRWCLLSYLKLEAKNAELPLKTNLLYRNHLIAMCPPDRILEVKKSSYKKLGKFLEAMQKEGLLEVREIDKGVDAVVAVNLPHGAVRAHRVPGALRARLHAAPARAYVPPVVREEGHSADGGPGARNSDGLRARARPAGARRRGAGRHAGQAHREVCAGHGEVGRADGGGAGPHDGRRGAAPGRRQRAAQPPAPAARAHAAGLAQRQQEGDASVEPGAVRLQPAGAEPRVPDGRGRGQRRHALARRAGRPAHGAGRPDILHCQTPHREVWLAQKVRGRSRQGTEQEKMMEHLRGIYCGNKQRRGQRVQ